ncbi:MAG TPA: hypothetical protein VNT60_10325, partial [Deinococcales bacterium]|nr:hypothetical protein [Deinococcales bacterium]
ANQVPHPTVLTAPPYAFTIDTRDYPNNTVLNVRARATSTAGAVALSNTISLPIYNPSPVPTLGITSPGTGVTVSGTLPVSVSVGQLSAISDYTLDVDGNGTVNHAASLSEGIRVELVDFTGVTVAESWLDGPNGGVDAVQSGTYTTPAGFDTTKVANDTYTVRVSYSARKKSSPAGTVDTFVTSSTQVTTSNTNRVPPSLLILWPTSDPALLTVRDPEKAMVTVQATDNTELSYVELRAFFGSAVTDATPSRYIASLNTSGSIVSMPLNHNAIPYLWDSATTPYTLRVIAQDKDGNRTFQDTSVLVNRGSASPYGLQVFDSVSSTWGSGLTLKVPATANFQVTGALPANALVEYFVLEPGSTAFNRAVVGNATSGASASIGFTKEGAHVVRVQVTDLTARTIYSTNDVSISGVKD